MTKIGFDIGNYEGYQDTQEDRQCSLDRLYDELQDNTSMDEWDTLKSIKEITDIQVAVKYYKKNRTTSRKDEV